ncbi:MAG: hypothetical protein ABII82_11720 [Verrucomicrobiota bacterium]
MNRLRATLIPLSAGLLLGSASAWAWQHVSTSEASAHTPGDAPRRPVPVLVMPDKLDPAEADTALAEWLALPALTDDSPPDEQAARRARLRALLARLPGDRFAALLDALVSREVDTECDLRRLAFEVWTERDAPAAAGWAVGQTNEHFTKKHRRGDTSLAVLAWARDDWDSAYNWSRNLADQSLNNHLANVLLEQLADTDPQRAITIAQSRGEQYFKSAREKLFKVWAQDNPAAAIRWLTPLTDGKDVGRWAFQEAAARWIAANPAEALNWLLQNGPSDNNNARPLIESMLYRVTDIPEAARGLANVLLKRDDLTEQNKLITQLIGYWQQRDSAASLAWLDSVKDDTRRGELADQIARRWGFRDDQTRLEFNLRLPEGTHRDETIKTTLASWAKSAPDDALAWIETHPNPEYAPIANGIHGVLVGNLAATDLPAALARWQELPDGEARKAAIGPIVDNWSRQNPAAAAEWLFSHHDWGQGNIHSSGNPLQTLMHNWSTGDPAAALRWVENHPDKDRRWALINAFTNRPGDTDAPDPVARAALYDTVQDEALRKNLLQRHAWSWLRADYPTARAWLESSDDFTPEQIAQMLVDQDPYRR